MGPAKASIAAEIQFNVSLCLNLFPSFPHRTFPEGTLHKPPQLSQTFLQAPDLKYNAKKWHHTDASGREDGKAAPQKKTTASAKARKRRNAVKGMWVGRVAALRILSCCCPRSSNMTCPFPSTCFLIYLPSITTWSRQGSPLPETPLDCDFLQCVIPLSSLVNCYPILFLILWPTCINCVY